jgi:hypothetical protein
MIVMYASHTLYLINILIYTTTVYVLSNVKIDTWVETKLCASVMLLQVRHIIFVLSFLLLCRHDAETS